MAMNIIDKFSIVEDPRRAGYAKRHKLIDIITIAICAIICKCDTWEDVEDFAIVREAWFKSFLELPNGIPSHDTFNRVFAMIDCKAFEKCFIEWTQEVYKLTKGAYIAIDGKTIKGSVDQGKQQKAAHIVSAWTNQNGIVLGQIKVEEKTNEIKAIPELLEMLKIKGCIVTIDAMGCQKEIAKKIVTKEADYILALKGNQGNLHEDVKLYMDKGSASNKHLDVPINYYKTVEKNRGRIETRKHWITSNVDWLNKRHDWIGIKSIGMIETERIVGETISKEKRYYISSIADDAKLFADAVRNHWGIENSLHWVLDMTFNEDKSRIRRDNGAQNLSVLKRAVLNLLKKIDDKRSLRSRRFMASIDQSYFLKILEAA